MSKIDEIIEPLKRIKTNIHYTRPVQVPIKRTPVKRKKYDQISVNIFHIYSALRQRSKPAHNGSRVRYKLPLISSDAEFSLDSKVMTKSLKEILSNHFTSKKLKKGDEGSIRQRRDIMPNGTHLS